MLELFTQQPQQLLAKVAAGNDPVNFVFCLNKVDQLSEPNAAGELRADFAARLARTLSLPNPPRVWMISAIRPDQFELPELRGTMSEQKSTDSVATSLQLVCAQRLVRRVCQDCKESIKLPPRAALLELGFEESELEGLKICRGSGCKTCGGTGYKGRVGLFEVMEISQELREAIIVNQTSIELKRIAVAAGMRTIRRSGLQKVREGVTTIEEVVRETVL